MRKQATGDRRRSPVSVRRASVFTVCVVLLSGCTGSLLETDLPPNAIYILAPAPAPGAPAATVLPVDVSIGRPDVAPGLDTSRIAVVEGQRLDYYRGASWGGSAAEVVQTLLVGSIEDQGLFRSVTAEQARVAGDYVLDVEVRDFQAEYSNGGAPSVRVRMVGRLIRVVDRELVATVAAESLQAASADRMHAVVEAFQEAARNVAVELAQETAAAIAADEPKLSASRA